MVSVVFFDYIYYNFFSLCGQTVSFLLHLPWSNGTCNISCYRNKANLNVIYKVHLSGTYFVFMLQSR
jgi:hypothetical protein